MKVWKNITKTLKTRPMHFSLMDPDPEKNGVKEAAEIARQLKDMGTDVILVGGSTNIEKEFLDKFVLAIKKNFGGFVILYPNGINGLSQNADAVFFMSLLNSRDPNYITGVQAKTSSYVKKLGIDPIPLAYLIVEPGMKVGQVGKADLIKRNDIERAIGYAQEAEMFGFSLVYLEAGSGAPKYVPSKMVSAVKKSIKIPLVVGGGIRNPETAEELLKAGADIIVTGTVIENDIKQVGEIIQTIKNFKK